IGDLRNLFVVLGNGDGTFTSPVTYAISTSFLDDLVLGDFNRDGKQDVVVTSAAIAGGLWVRLGNGDGTFGAQTNFPGLVAAEGAAADVNGDGKLDLGLATNGSPTAAIVLGNGDGTFGTSVLLPAASSTQGVAFADINGDGRPDLTVTCGNSTTVSTFLNTPPNVQLRLVDGSRTVLQPGSPPANLAAALSFVAPSDGTYYLRVSGTGNADYNLVLTRDAAFDTEGNHTFATAQDVSGTQGVLGYVAATEDWYAITVPDGCSVRLETS